MERNREEEGENLELAGLNSETTASKVMEGGHWGGDKGQ